MKAELAHPVDVFLHSRLDLLVEDGVISPQRRKSITLARYQEWAIRFPSFIRTANYSAFEAEKMKTLFGEPQPQDFAAPSRQQIISAVSDLLPKLQLYFPRLLICLMGSRMNRLKTPRNTYNNTVSDLDVKFIYPDSSGKIGNEDLSAAEKYLQDELAFRFPSFRHIPVSMTVPVTVSQFLEGFCPSSSLPAWTDDPECLHLIGNPCLLHWKLSNTAANDRIRRMLQSSEYTQARRQIILKSYQPCIPKSVRIRA